MNTKLRFLKYTKHNTTCHNCGADISNVYTLSDNNCYGSECAKKMMFQEDYEKYCSKKIKVFSIFHKNKIIITAYNELSAKTLLERVHTIRNIPLNELKIKERMINKAV